jgi:LuxR family maltose regulon positive regulatory protein
LLYSPCVEELQAPAHGDARDALALGDSARACELLAGLDDPAASELLAHAHAQLGNFSETLRHREAATHGYRAAGQAISAARTATWLGHDRALLRNELPVARAWFERAELLLAGAEPCEEQGLLAFCRGRVALLLSDDAVAALADGARVRHVAQLIASEELETLGLALEGLALVRSGSVEAGMALLDRATAVAVTGPRTSSGYTGIVSCALIDACECVQDLERASRWCETLEGWIQHNPNEELFGYCRVHYSWLLVAGGRLAEAERELETALAAFARGAPALRYFGALRLAMLRLLQGREQEAEVLCAELEWHPRSLICRAQLELARGRADEAAALLAQYRRGMPEASEPCDAAGLELALRISLARGALPDAAREVEKLERLAAVMHTPMLRGTAAFARGLYADATGAGGQAEELLEDALRFFLASGAPLEAARVRIELGRLLVGRGAHRRATRELEAARDALTTAGADGLLRDLAGSALPRGDVLSRREREVLRLAAAGHGDAAIAAQLVLSEHTVHRHMANIRHKLRQRTRAAAVAQATRDGLI